MEGGQIFRKAIDSSGLKVKTGGLLRSALPKRGHVQSLEGSDPCNINSLG